MRDVVKGTSEVTMSLAEPIIEVACIEGRGLLALADDGTIRLLDGEKGSELRAWALTDGTHFRDVAIEGPEGFIAVGGRQVVRGSWSGDLEHLFTTELDDAHRVAIDGARGVIAVGSSGAGHIEIRSLGDLTHLAAPFRAHFGIVMDLAWSPWSDALASAGTLGTGEWTAVSLWRSEGTKLQGADAHLPLATRVAFDRRSRLIVTTGADRTVRLWSDGLVPVGRELARHEILPTALGVSTVGFVATGDGSGLIRVHDLRDESLLAEAEERLALTR